MTFIIHFSFAGIEVAALIFFGATMQEQFLMSARFKTNVAAVETKNFDVQLDIATIVVLKISKMQKTSMCSSALLMI